MDAARGLPRKIDPRLVPEPERLDEAEEPLLPQPLPHLARPDVAADLDDLFEGQPAVLPFIVLDDIFSDRVRPVLAVIDIVKPRHSGLKGRPQEEGLECGSRLKCICDPLVPPC